jgi:hypothetical protein
MIQLTNATKEEKAAIVNRSPVIWQSNSRVWLAVAAVRFHRNAETITELRDALARRRYQRTATISDKERHTILVRYLMDNAPDIIWKAGLL